MSYKDEMKRIFNYPLDIEGNAMDKQETIKHNNYINKIGSDNVVGGYEKQSK